MARQIDACLSAAGAVVPTELLVLIADYLYPTFADVMRHAESWILAPFAALPPYRITVSCANRFPYPKERIASGSTVRHERFAAERCANAIDTELSRIYHELARRGNAHSLGAYEASLAAIETLTATAEFDEPPSTHPPLLIRQTVTSHSEMIYREQRRYVFTATQIWITVATPAAVPPSAPERNSAVLNGDPKALATAQLATNYFDTPTPADQPELYIAFHDSAEAEPLPDDDQPEP